MSALVLLILSGIWTYSHYPNNEIVFAIESQKEYSNEVLIENTNNLTKKIKNELEKQNFTITFIGIHLQNEEINIRVNGTQQYLKSIEKDIEKIVYELAQKTIFKDYSIGVYKEIIVPTDSNKSTLEINQLLNKINTTVQKNIEIKGYTTVVNILTKKQSKKLIIEINTSIQKDNLTDIDLGKEIEKVTRESLVEIIPTSTTENQTVEINVYNIDQEKIN
ncbi:hypothetical protein [Psychrobacillus sp. FSL H8-0510]|uniref:hypothetical protein n=1 Tax=Psychrobacillus sp. FSL H8-0510 TaxID=2921394 RepID=UPI0030FA2DC9